MVFSQILMYDEKRYIIVLGCDGMDSANSGANFQKNIMAEIDLHGDTLPKFFVNKMLETMEHHAKQYAHEKEREEIVCRLLASGMMVEEISLRLKIRADEVRIIEKNNVKDKIPEYARTYKARAKSRNKK